MEARTACLSKRRQVIFMIGMIKMILNNKNEEIVFALIKGIK
jgi:hypothetical protein